MAVSVVLCAQNNRVGIRRIQLQHLVELGDRSVEVAEAGQSPGPQVMAPLALRCDFQRLLRIAQRPVPIAQMSVGLPSYQIGKVVIGREAQRFVAIGDRFRDRAAIEIDVGPGVKQPLDRRHLPDCFGYVGQTFGRVAFAAVNFGAVDVGAGMNGKE
jgi:hypothetical protein